jgi:hypothetical protein
VNAHIHIDTKAQTMQGIAFPLSDDAQNALEQFSNKEISYVQLVRLTFVILFLSDVCVCVCVWRGVG